MWTHRGPASQLRNTHLWKSPDFSRNVKVAQACLTLCNPMDCNPPGSSVLGDSPGKNTGVGSHSLLQGILPTQVFHTAGRFFTVRASREATALFRGCWQTCALCPPERTIPLIILRGWQVFPGAGRVWSSSSLGCPLGEDTLDLYSPRMEINLSKLTDDA